MGALTNEQWDAVCRELIGNDDVRLALRRALVRIGCDDSQPMSIHNASFSGTPALIISGVPSVGDAKPEFWN